MTNHTLAAVCLGAAGILTVVGAGQVWASSHREAPAITASPKVDATDFYMFNSYEYGRTGYVTLIANYLPLQDPQGGPNYFSMDPNAVYEIHVDNDGDAVEDITFQFRFNNELVNSGNGIELSIGDTEPKNVAIPLKLAGGISAGDNGNLGFNESYSVTMVRGDRRSSDYGMLKQAATQQTRFIKPFDYIGNKTFQSAEAYESYASQYRYEVDIPGCDQPGRVFAGQRRESFAVNLGEIFDLVNFVPIEGDSAPGAADAKGFPGGITQDVANNDLRGKNITSLALEVPASCLTGEGNGVIGAWTTSSLPQARILNPNADFKKPDVQGGAFVQVSRLGMPLVNEVVIGLKDKNRFNSSEPQNDGRFLDYVSHPTLPALLNILFKDAVNATLGTDIADLAPTNFPRNDLITAFLTGFAGVNQMETVTPSEMLRLNTAIEAVPAGQQHSLGVVGDDLAGFPNGRRPGDDVVDVALRVVMGGLCHPVPVNGNPTDLGLCTPEQAAVGNVPFTDGAPQSALDFNLEFPYLNTPLAGSPN